MERPDPFLIGDDLALDFLNSVVWPSSGTIDWLSNGADLLHWLIAARAVSSETTVRFRSWRNTHALDATAAQARELREWFRGFVANHAGKKLESETIRKLAPLNELLIRDDAYRQIERVPKKNSGRGSQRELGALRWSIRRHWRTPESLLFPIVQAMGDLVCQKDFSHVRMCEGPICTLYFLDISKAHARRWCSMAICGNRAKAAAHRARQGVLH